jgi:uncharacterized protein YkwD
VATLECAPRQDIRRRATNPKAIKAIHRSSVAALLAVLAVLGFVGAARAQPVDAEQAFASRIANERSSSGVGALTPAADLQAVARRHAQRMADRGEPYHNPNLGSEVDGWEIVAENVGVGYDVDSIHIAFMQSATHRSNILNANVTELGLGVVVTSDARIWVVEIFRRPMAAQQASAQPAPAPQPPAPAPPKPNAAPAGPAPEPAPVANVANPALPPTTVTAPPPPPSTPAAELAFVEVPRQAAQRGSLATTAVVLPVLPKPVPVAASVAAFLLAGSVGLQGVTLRRLGLVG